MTPIDLLAVSTSFSVGVDLPALGSVRFVQTRGRGLRQAIAESASPAGPTITAPDGHRGEFYTPRAIIRFADEDATDLDVVPHLNLLGHAAGWAHEAHRAQPDLVIVDEVHNYFAVIEAKGPKKPAPVLALEHFGIRISGSPTRAAAAPSLCLPGLLSSEGQRYARSAGLALMGRQDSEALAAASLGRLLLAHRVWVLQQASRTARALSRRSLRELRDKRPRPPATAVSHPRSWVCVCGTDRLAAPVVPRAPQHHPLPIIHQQGGQKVFTLTA